jgi:hypothetical protein
LTGSDRGKCDPVPILSQVLFDAELKRCAGDTDLAQEAEQATEQPQQGSPKDRCDNARQIR